MLSSRGALYPLAPGRGGGPPVRAGAAAPLLDAAGRFGAPLEPRRPPEVSVAPRRTAPGRSPRMPWLRSRTERSSGITTWAIEWREGGRNGKVRSRSLGPVTEQEAQYELAAHERRQADPRRSRRRPRRPARRRGLPPPPQGLRPPPGPPPALPLPGTPGNWPGSRGGAGRGAGGLGLARQGEGGEGLRRPLPGAPGRLPSARPLRTPLRTPSYPLLPSVTLRGVTPRYGAKLT